MAAMGVPVQQQQQQQYAGQIPLTHPSMHNAMMMNQMQSGAMGLNSLQTMQGSQQRLLQQQHQVMRIQMPGGQIATAIANPQGLYKKLTR